ncbi:IS5/IS1182 family transposase, partial [Peribacillus simplex]
PDKFDKEETKEIKESTTDSESGYYVKDERTKQFAYSFHAAADAAYKTPAITSYLFNKEIIPALPYTRPRTKEGFFRKQDYV